jgi:hypothetical protein
MKKQNVSIIIIALSFGCGGSGGSEVDSVIWQGEHSQTILLGAEDNSEVIKAIPNSNLAILVASKTRKVTLLSIDESVMSVVEELVLFPEDTSESELTHIDFSPDGSYAVITRTLPTSVDGEQVSCAGELVFVSMEQDTFGEVLSQVGVGPMPDAVDVSPDGNWVVSADEVDFNDGKCTVEGTIPSISILSVEDGPETPSLVAQITMVSEDGENLREPEQIVFGGDSDRVVGTLQDTHEIISFSVADVISAGGGSMTSEASIFTITTLPLRSDGAEPWPDGIVGFSLSGGEDWFIVTGEYNDTLHLLNDVGEPIYQYEIDPNEMPSDLPRNIESWSLAPFRPDSVTTFTMESAPESVFVAASLKHSGAVGVWDVSDPSALSLQGVVSVGDNDGGTSETESTIGTEGIASFDGGTIITANEEESSVSLVVPF